MSVKDKIVEAIASEVTKSIVGPLLPLLLTLVLALVPQVRDRVLAVLPRPLLAVLIGISLSVNLALLVYVLRLHSTQKQLEAKPKLTPNLNVLWDGNFTAYCPACSTLLAYTNVGLFSGDKGTWGFNCVKCKEFIPLNDDAGHNLELKEARRLLSSNEVESKVAPVNQKLKYAINRLHSLNDNLPRGSIEEKYVADYHSILNIIEQEADMDLSAFRIPDLELKHHITSQRIGPRLLRHSRGPDTTYSKERYCDRPVFLTQLHAAMNSIKDHMGN
ncbi:MAG: hypothetical protein WCB68_16110 [Pyrinomonadaceae bacterium]